MRIVTLKDADFNQEFVPSTDIKDINAINAKWDFLFRDPFDSGWNYGNWRWGCYTFKTNSSNRSWMDDHLSHCNVYTMQETSYGSYEEPFSVQSIFANSYYHYGEDVDTFGKVFNPYFLKTLDGKLDAGNYFSIPVYTKKIYVKGFDDFDVVATGWRRNNDNNNPACDVVISSTYYNSASWTGYYSTNLGNAYNDIDKTEIRSEITNGGIKLKLPYLKDSQINKMFEEVKNTPWEPVLFKLKGSTCEIDISACTQKTTYVWKPTKNIAVKVYYDSSKSETHASYFEYLKDHEYIVIPETSSEIVPANALKINNIVFKKELKDVCTNVNGNYSSYEYGLLYIPNTEKLLQLPALDVAVDIRDQITTEVQARKDGDAELLQKINKEAQDRATAVSNEATARANADNSLDQKITTEKNDRIKDVDDEENARKKAIEEEAKTRKEEDDKLEDKKLNRYDKDEKIDGVKPDWDEEPTRNSHKAVNSDAVYKMCKNLRLYQANIGKDKIAVAKLKPVDYPFQVTIFSKGEMATFNIHSTIMGRALTPGCNLSAKYYMTSDWIYLYFKPAQGPVSLTISANDSEGMMLTETDKFPEIATIVPLAK